VTNTSEATRTGTRVREEPSGQAIRKVAATLIGYLCDSSDEYKPQWTGRTIGLAVKLIKLRADEGEWRLTPGWRKRLREAGLDEECNVLDEAKWERAFTQLKERGNYDPAILRIEEALDETDQIREAELQQKQAQAKKQQAAQIPMQLAGKKITFGNA
jgi:hypothetical protein